MPTGDAFTKDTPSTPDVETFNLRAWIKGTSPVTRSVTVYGRPDLMGEIEALDERVVELQSTEFDDTRLGYVSEAQQVAQQAEALRKEMHASALRFRFRGLKNGEYEAIKKDAGLDGEQPDGIGELDYRVWARQCVEPKGIEWEDLRDLHDTFDNYFMRTIAVTANTAQSGGGVDVPFSSASSSLIATSSQS